MKRVLVTFAGGQLARGVTNGLRAAGPVHIIAADADEFGIFQSKADERYLIPRADDPSYMDVLRDLVTRTSPDLVWPMHDNEIGRVVSDDRELGARTFLPPRDVVELCHDKFASNQAFRAAEVPAPDTMMVNSEEDLREAFRRFDREVWIRPLTGAGGRGALGTDNFDLAVIWLNHFNGWGEFTASEKLDEQGYTFEAVWYHGELIVCQSSARNPDSKRLMGMLGQGRSRGLGVRRRRPAPDAVREVTSAAAHAVSGGKPHGIYMADLNNDRNGVPNITEINIGRFASSGAIFFHDHGANFPDIALKMAFDEDPGFKPPLIDPLRPDIAIVMSIASEPTVVRDAEREPLVQEYEKRRTGLSR